MPLVVCNNGESVALSYLVGKIATTRNLTYRLFTNNITPAETDTAGTFTEAVGGGYAAIPLTGTNWSVVTGAPTVISHAPQDFLFSGPLSGNPTIYGYFATRQTDNDLILAEAFVSFTPLQNGDTLRLTPRIEAD